MTEKGAEILNTDGQHITIIDCPLCGGAIEQMESEQDNFRNYYCPDCGLNWQSYIDPNARAQQLASQHWMRTVSQD